MTPPGVEMTLDQALDTALNLHRFGRLQEAAAIYRQIVAVQPTNSNAHHLLGVLTASTGDHLSAIGHFDQALRQGPVAEFLYSRGSSLLHLKRAAEAITDFTVATRLSPNFAEGWFALGKSLQAAKQYGQSIPAFEAAVNARPQWADPVNELGASLVSLGRLDDAEIQFRQALLLHRNHFQTLLNFGNLQRRRNQLDLAAQTLRFAVEGNPQSGDAHDLLGLVLANQKDLAGAIAEHRTAIALNPRSSTAFGNLGVALARASSEQLGDQKENNRGEAIAALQQAIRLDPELESNFVNFGNALLEFDQPELAVAPLQYAVEKWPRSAAPWAALGSANTGLGQTAEAVECFVRALELGPDEYDTNNNASIALLNAGDVDRAEATARHAIGLQPLEARGWCSLAAPLSTQGRVTEAVGALRRSVDADPKSGDVRSSLLLTMQYLGDTNVSEIRRESEIWGRTHAPPESRFPPVRESWQPPMIGERPIKIGYVSGDFSRHAVGRFLLPIVENHDPKRVELHCFCNNLHHDGWTERFKKCVTGWHEIRRLDDEQLESLVRGQQIDLLIDLSVHTSGNRLPVFGRRPAPIQATYLGYCGTTGVPQIDYILTDRFLAPPGPESAVAFVEKPVLLPESYWCYRPPENSPPVSPLPRSCKGFITFGCLNNFAKINSTVLQRWSEILSGVAGSVLQISAKNGKHRQATLDQFSALGVDPKRIDFVDVVPLEVYLTKFSDIDLVLDPFPFNGGTTSCDTLWMGVPMVTFPGDRPVSRAGSSILNAIGLPELVAKDEADYVRLAIELAGDPTRLADLRATMRDRMLASPLTDEPRFVKNLESLYERMVGGKFG